MSLVNLPCIYLDMMMRCKILAQKQIFNCRVYGQWVLESSGRRGGKIKTRILQNWRKETVESDAYGFPKFIYNICSNDDEATNGMVHNS